MLWLNWLDRRMLVLKRGKEGDRLMIFSLQESNHHKLFNPTSAIQILLDRAMTEENLKTVITAASNRQNRDERKKAIVAIQQLSKGEENRKILVHKGVLKILTDVLVRREPEDEDATCRYAIMALYRLVMNSCRSFRVC